MFGAIILLAFLITGVLFGTILYVEDRREKVARQRAIAERNSPARKIEAATKEGRVDMMRAWLDFNAPPSSDSRKLSITHAMINEHVQNPPPMSAGRHRLLGYMADSRLISATESKMGWGRHEDILLAMRGVAARLYLLTDAEFQSQSGVTSTRYLTSDDPTLAEAYLKGGAEAMEIIRKDIITARDRQRTHQARMLGAAEFAREHDESLKALRETARQPQTDREKWDKLYEEGA